MEVPERTCARAPQPGEIVEISVRGVLGRSPLDPDAVLAVVVFSPADGDSFQVQQRELPDVPAFLWCHAFNEGQRWRRVRCSACESPLASAGDGGVRCSAGCVAVHVAPEPPEAEDPVRALFQLIRPGGPLPADVLIGLAQVLGRYERDCARIDVEAERVGATVATMRLKALADATLCELFALIGGAR